MEEMRAALTMLTVGTVSFIGTFVWYSERILFGILISIVVILISLFFYTNTKKKVISLIKELRKQANIY